METLKLAWVCIFGGMFIGGVISLMVGLLAVAAWAVTLNESFILFASRAVIAGLIVAAVGGSLISPIVNE